MNIRAYTPFDLAGVRDLIDKTDLSQPPDVLGGYGLVMEEKGDIVGFCWALISDDSDVAYIDWFAVDLSYRSQGFGLAMMTRMIFDLRALGKKRLCGVIPDKSEMALMNIYSEAGMNIKSGYVLHGSIANVCTRVLEMKKKVANG